LSTSYLQKRKGRKKREGEGKGGPSSSGRWPREKGKKKKREIGGKKRGPLFTL